MTKYNNYDRPCLLELDTQFRVISITDPGNVLQLNVPIGQEINEAFTIIQPHTANWIELAVTGPFFCKAISHGEQENLSFNILVEQQPSPTAGYRIYVRSDLSGLELIQESYLELDQDYMIRHANRATEVLFNVSRDEIVNSLLWDVLPDIKASFHHAFIDATLNNTPIDTEGFCRQSGQFFRVRIFPRPHGSKVFIHDITRQTKQQREIIAKNSLLNSIMDNVMVGVVAVDEDGIIRSFNKQAEIITGYSEAEIIDHRVNDLLDDSIAPYHDRYLSSQTDSPADSIIDIARDVTVKHKNGHIIPIEISITRANNAQPKLFIASFSDISHRKQQQDQIEILARLPEESPNPILRVTTSGELLYANPSSDILLRKWDLKIGSSVTADLHELIRESDQSMQVSRFYLDIDSTHFSLTISPHPDHNYVNIYGLDVTQSIQDEQELISHKRNLQKMVDARTQELLLARDEAQQANRAKSAFLANMSHELRTPLNAIIGYSEIIRENADSRTDDSRFEDIKDLDKVIHSANYLLNLINDILDLSKIEAGKMELNISSVNISDIIEPIKYTIAPMIEKNANKLIIDHDIENLYVEADGTRLKQSILNLLSNAAKFTHNGTITVKTSTLNKNNNRYIKVCIIDTGIGMSKQQQSLLFKPFSQASNEISVKYGGTGLGLTISKRFCQLMGGDILVKSKLGEGSIFSITLPLS